MSCQALYFRETSPIYSYNLSQFPNQLSKRLNLSFISLETHLKNQSFSIKISPGSRKSRTMAFSKSNTYAPAAEETEKSFYELLGISESGTLSEIKKAYKQLARKYHPDVSPADRTEEYTQRFILVQEAYQTLSDPQTRALYDRDLSKGFHFSFSADQRSDDNGDWKNIWESQLTKLKSKSMYNSTENSRPSWGARMRSQNRESF